MLRSILSFVGLSRLTIGMFVLVYLMAFSMGVGAGVEAATNESVSIDNVQQNFTDAEAEVRHNLTTDMDKTERAALTLSGVDMMYPVFDISSKGAGWGYNHVTFGQAWVWISKPLILLYATWVFWRPLKNIQGVFG